MSDVLLTIALVVDIGDTDDDDDDDGDDDDDFGAFVVVGWAAMVVDDEATNVCCLTVAIESRFWAIAALLSKSIFFELNE